MGEEEEQAISRMKSLIMKNNTLHLPDFRKRFIVNTDASDEAVAGVLMQQADDGAHGCDLFVASLWRNKKASGYRYR